MNEISLNGPSRDANDRRAHALAEVHKMQQDLMLAHDEITSLKRETDRAEDRITLLTEECNRYRTESTLFRGKMIELATAMANIGLLTLQAEEIMKITKELAAAETPEQVLAEHQSAKKAIEALPAQVLSSST